ncbi:MAG: hypothetical protein O6929_01965 [candidate division NC10 bacterium]|nr:hypothetical protein [candidate division NC10 bacterium]
MKAKRKGTTSALVAQAAGAFLLAALLALLPAIASPDCLEIQQDNAPTSERWL